MKKILTDSFIQSLSVRKKTAAFRTVFVIFLGLNLCTAFAQKCTPSAMTDQTKERAVRFAENLKTMRFSALEEELAFLLREVAANRQVDVVVLNDIRNAFPGEPWAEPLLLQWRKESPDSFSAALSTGIYYNLLARTKRGTEFATNTSQEQFTAMRKEFEKAISPFNDAMRINPKSALPVAGLISVAKHVASPQHVLSLLEVSEKIDPKNMAARLEAIQAFNPKWGGDVELLNTVLNRAQALKIKPQQFNFLKYSAYMELANYFDVSSKEKVKAIEHYRLASELCESAAPWRGMADAAFVIQDWQTRKVASTKVISYYPNSGVDIFNRGWAYEQLGQLQPAITDYEVASKLGNDWAQNNLGWILLEGKHTKQDLPRAKQLFIASAAQGNSKAKQNLESVNRLLQK